MGFIEDVKLRARQELKSIVLPEIEDRRVLEAAAITLKEGNARIILIGSKEEIQKSAEGIDLHEATVVDPEHFEKLSIYVDKLTEIRQAKGVTREKAMETLLHDYLTFAIMMVKMGDADGVVAGADHSTAETLRPALQILKTRPQEIASSFFMMVVPECNYGENGVFLFGDCGLKQYPDSDELAIIAGSSAKSFEKLTGKQAKVALLSHSTKGSAKHPCIDRVTEALGIARKRYPDLLIDGELQVDSAIIPEIAEVKAPESPVAGKANVLIFPDLDSGNIGYKLVQRLAHAEAYGPITQGITAPVNDLSRGCEVLDIVGVIAITAVQAQNR